MDDEIIAQKLEDNAYSLEEHYMKICNDMKQRVKDTEKKNMRGKVANIIKRNTIYNIDELNKHIINLINIDEKFIQTMIGKISPIEHN